MRCFFLIKKIYFWHLPFHKGILYHFIFWTCRRTKCSNCSLCVSIHLNCTTWLYLSVFERNYRKPQKKSQFYITCYCGQYEKQKKTKMALNFCHIYRSCGRRDCDVLCVFYCVPPALWKLIICDFFFFGIYKVTWKLTSLRSSRPLRLIPGMVGEKKAEKSTTNVKCTHGGSFELLPVNERAADRREVISAGIVPGFPSGLLPLSFNSCMGCNVLRLTARPVAAMLTRHKLLILARPPPG